MVDNRIDIDKTKLYLSAMRLAMTVDAEDASWFDSTEMAMSASGKREIIEL